MLQLHDAYVWIIFGFLFNTVFSEAQTKVTQAKEVI